MYKNINEYFITINYKYRYAMTIKSLNPLGISYLRSDKN